MKRKLCYFYFLLQISLYAQNIQIENIDITNGLADNSIRDIIQDEKGYLWFGTLNGLSRFDGNNFKNYYSIPGDTTSLSNNRMLKIYEDKKGFIWSWADDLVIQRINPITNEVININKRLFKNNFLVEYFRIVSNGDIWIWGNNGCAKIEYLENNIDLKTTIFNEENGFENDRIHFLKEDNQENIWVGTESGLVKINPKDNSVNTYHKKSKFISFNKYKSNIWFGTNTGEIKKYSTETGEFSVSDELNSKLKGHSIKGINQVNSKTLLIASDKYFFEFDIEKNITTTFQNGGFNNFYEFINDSFGNTWMVFKSTRGIYKYAIHEKKISYYELNSKNRSYLGDPDKHQVLEDSNKNLWVGIHGGGLFLYDKEKNNFINYKTNEDKSETLSSDIVLSLFEDSSKNLWIGTMYGGLNKINLSKENFIWHIPSNQSESKKTNIFENEIRTALEDKNGDLWLGSKGGKIFFYQNKKIKHTFPDDLSKENQEILENINVYSLHIDHHDNLWIGTKGKGIYIVENILNTPINKLKIKPYKINTLRKVYAITQDKYNNIWIGSHGEGLSKIVHPFTDPKETIFNTELADNYIRYLFFDRDDNLWIATNAGISLLPENQLLNSRKNFISIKNKKNNFSSLSYNSVDHIFQATDNSIYASTMGGGINILKYSNLKNRNFDWEHINKSNGLSSNKIFAMEEDKDGNIWISTSLGINKFYPKDNSFENFFIKKKQGLSYFTEGCVTKLNNGDILFGNHKGFITFNPEKIKKDTTAFPLVLSKFFVNGNEETPRKSSIIDKNIEYVKGVKLNYNQNTVRFDFSVLDFKNPKKNQYSYKLDNFEEKWSIPLSNNSATYQNLPAGKYTFMLKSTNSDGVQLPKILKFDINIKPSFFKSYLGYFLELLVFGILFYSFLYLYKKQISTKQEVIYTDKLNEKKLVYYTNISHEFKTPLTLISCHLQDIINEKDITPIKTKQITKEIQKNTSYLLNLVEQILDFRKIREEKMKLLLININIGEFIKNIHSEFVPLATKENVDLKFKPVQNDIYGFIDVRVVKKIIYNLVSNAIKFTPVNKTVEISLQPIKNNQFLKITITNEGIGISEENQKNLFERFSKSENSSGLGLSYVKELVECHKSTIEVSSVLNKETSFTICLPISKKYYSEDELETNDVAIDKINLQESNLHLQENSNENSTDTGKTSTLLIIEDNDEMRKYLSNKFEPTFNVITAKNGKEGVELAIENIPSVIICDLMMPIMDGIESIKKIKENFNTCHIPIILLTANSSEHKKIESIKIGADDFINKPFDVNHLKIKVNALIAQRKKIIDSFSKNPELSMDILTNTEEDKNFIIKIKKIIEDSLGESHFSINSIASELGVSRTQFYKKMKEITGETPNEFINTIQLKKASLLLKDTNYPISEISIICGFNDARYFSKIFKKNFGISPKEYQIKNQA